MTNTNNIPNVTHMTIEEMISEGFIRELTAEELAEHEQSKEQASK